MDYIGSMKVVVVRVVWSWWYKVPHMELLAWLENSDGVDG
jgi:hypothetical protein